MKRCCFRKSFRTSDPDLGVFSKCERLGAHKGTYAQFADKRVTVCGDVFAVGFFGIGKSLYSSAATS